MQDMTPEATQPDARAKAQWLRKLDRATTAHEKTRRALDELIADARNAGVPLTAISDHSPYSREWVRRTAERVQAERAAKIAEAPSQESA